MYLLAVDIDIADKGLTPPRHEKCLFDIYRSSTRPNRLATSMHLLLNEARLLFSLNSFDLRKWKVCIR